MDADQQVPHFDPMPSEKPVDGLLHILGNVQLKGGIFNGDPQRRQHLKMVIGPMPTAPLRPIVGDPVRQQAGCGVGFQPGEVGAEGIANSVGSAGEISQKSMGGLSPRLQDQIETLLPKTTETTEKVLK